MVSAPRGGFATIVLALALGAALLLQGCQAHPGDATAPPSPPSPPTPPTPAPRPSPRYSYRCQSDLVVPPDTLNLLSQKGLAVDDDTLFGCPDKIPKLWPNTEETIQHIRLFKMYRPGDSDQFLEGVRSRLVAHATAHRVKLLVGSSISCSEEEDEEDWRHVRMLLEDLGNDYVLGLAVGNEIDQLQHHADVSQECLDKIWGGYLLNQTVRRIAEARTITRNSDLPVTSVFTGEIIWTGADNPKLRVREYLKLVSLATDNFVFTMNFYPYFDPSNKLDPDGVHCHEAVKKSRCFDSPACLTILNLVQMRKYLLQITGRTDDRVWIGEIGWSAPHPDTFRGPMASCTEFDSNQMLYDYYSSFLAWNLTYEGGLAPEIVFYFTMRDSSNFGNAEHFGLIADCSSTECKLTQESLVNTHAERSFI